MGHYKEIIRGVREDRDLKQAEVAKVLGTTQQLYSKYENGQYELPLRALIALADFYGISADFLIGRTKCREGVDSLNKQVTPDCTAGEVLSDILSLSPKDRDAVIEYIYFKKLKST